MGAMRYLFAIIFVVFLVDYNVGEMRAQDVKDNRQSRIDKELDQ